MSWKVRHEGSPQALEGLALPQVLEGLHDGLWEPTDEVMGPHDEDWQALENHPQLAEAVADLEPPPVRFEDDETRLDMNPLIDVALVLLIFFILTTSYAALQRVLEMPATTQKGVEGPVIVTKERVRQFTIRVQVRQEKGQPVFRVEDEVVAEKNLVEALRRYVRDTRKTEMVLDVEGVDWGTVVAVQDAAKGAGVQRAHYLAKTK